MPRWTPEARLKHAAAIRGWMPWTLATGPVTAAGKARSSRNAWKGGLRAKISNWHQALRQIALITEQLSSSFRPKRSFRRVAKKDPAPTVSSPAPARGANGKGAENEVDAVDRMSSADLLATFHRLLAAQPGLVAA